MRVGIDFGTTNSAIALSDGTTVHTFKVDPQLPDLLPSLIYITKDFEEYAGTTARDIYLEKNTNRPSRFRPVTVGEITMTVGDGNNVKFITQDVIVFVDVLSPGRLIRSVKSGLRDDEIRSTDIFGEEYTLEQLIAVILRELVQQIGHRIGRTVTAAVIGRPVKFSDDPRIDHSAEARIRAAAAQAGIHDVTFLPEPIAAAYAYHRDLDARTRTFVFDFGGGTLDLTVAELGGSAPPNVLATEGVLIGGDDFDRRIMQFLLPAFGQGATLAGGLPVPAHIWHAMGDWQMVEELKRSDSLRVIEDAGRPDGSSNPAAFRALHALITNNLYFKLLQEIERAKIALSQSDETVIRFEEGDVSVTRSLTRLQFENLIRTEISTITAAIERVVAAAGVTPDAVELVVATGGSSQIPAFQKLLRALFPNAAIAGKAERMLTGVTQGLAVYGYDLDARDRAEDGNRRALIEADRATPYAPPPKPVRTPYSHYVVGLDHKLRLQVHPWRPEEDAAALAARRRPPLVRGVVASRSAEILVGTTLSRFVIADLSALHDASVEHEKTPHQLMMDTRNAEQMTLLAHWGEFSRSPQVVLVTRRGNVRLFQTRHVTAPLRDLGQWKLDMRGGLPDPPAAFVGVARGQQVVLISEGGRAVRVPQAAVSVRGNRALKLAAAEAVWAQAVRAGEPLLAVLADGTGLWVDSAEIPLAAPSGSAGKALVRDGGRIIGLLPVTDHDRAHGLTTLGRLVELDLRAATQYREREPLTDLAVEEWLVNCWPLVL